MALFYNGVAPDFSRNNSSAALGSVTSDRLVQMAEEFALKHVSHNTVYGICWALMP